MNLLNKIIDRKKQEVAESKKRVSVSELRDKPLYAENRNSLKQAILSGSGIIAEYKRKSPSAGEITSLTLDEVLSVYKANNVSGCSILTDFEGFGGSLKDLESARKFEKPLLRKDFIIDEYQLFEARAHGADAILLIAEALDAYHAKYLCQIAQSIGLEVLMELHAIDQLDKVPETVDLVGVNNRNLSTLETNTQTAAEAYKHLPYSAVKIAESGLKSVKDIQEMYNLGYNGVLVGESLLKDENFRKEIALLKTGENHAG